MFNFLEEANVELLACLKAEGMTMSSLVIANVAQTQLMGTNQHHSDDINTPMANGFGKDYCSKNQK